MESTGPIVRINPYELHVRDVDWHDELYTGSSRPRNKSYFFVGRIGKGSIFGTLSHEDHRLRRSAVNPFFSKRSILAIEPLIQEKVDRFCHRLGSYAGKDEPLDLAAAYTSLTMDVITHYAFGEALGLIDLPDFGPKWKEMIKMTLESMPFVRHFPWAVDVLEAIPESVARRINESIALMLNFQHVISPYLNQLSSVQLTSVTGNPRSSDQGHCQGKRCAGGEQIAQDYL